MRTANLILNGLIDSAWIAKKIKKDIFCTDGAYNKVKGMNIEAVIGDMDSIESKEGVHLIETPDQNYTDFEKAILFLKERYEKINIYGASGKESDHFLGNLSAAKKYKDDVEMMFKDPFQYYFFAKKNSIIEDAKGRTISIIPFPLMIKVNSDGLQYPINNEDLIIGEYISVRNKGIKDTVSISYEEGCGLIYVCERIK